MNQCSKCELLLEGATVILPQSAQKLNAAVSNGKIVALMAPSYKVKAKQIIDCTGKIIFPGAIDGHSHVTLKEDFHYGTMSAAKGGVTTVVEMPISAIMPNITDEKRFIASRKVAEQTAHVDFALWGALMPTNMDKIEAFSELGCVALKAFTSDPGDDYEMMDDYSMLRAMKKCAKLNQVIGIHAENAAICKKMTQQFIDEGRGWEVQSDSRPKISEMEAAFRVALLAQETGCKISVCHVTNSDTVHILSEMRRRGANISIETCPHYLLLDTEDVKRCGGFANVYPPLRDRDEVEKMWTCLKNGEIDTVGSDHSAHTEEEKKRPPFSCPGGFPGLDLLLISLFSEGCLRRGLSMNRLAELTATNPAKLFGLYPRKGAIQIGADADFAIIDPDVKWTYHAKDCFYKLKSPLFPYEGKTFMGQVYATFVRGEIAYFDGKVLTESGYGNFIPTERQECHSQIK